MNDGDVVRLMASMKALWPHSTIPDPQDEVARQAWLLKLGDYGLDQCLAVVSRWSGEYAPTVSQICSQLDPPSSFEQLNAAAQHVIHNVQGGANYGRPTAEDLPTPQIALWFMQDDYRRLREYGTAPDQVELATEYGVWQAGLRKDFVAFESRIDPATARALIAELGQPQIDAPELVELEP